MDISVLTEFLLQDCLALIPVLWLAGAILKATPRLPDWFIPYILTVLGIAGACGIVGFGMEGIIQGVLVAGGAVLGHQLIKQAQNGGKTE